MAEAVTGTVVDLVRLTVDGGAIRCECLINIDGEPVAFGFRYRPDGVTAVQILSELRTRMRGIVERLRLQGTETKQQAERRLAEMIVDLEVALTDAPL